MKKKIMVKLWVMCWTGLLFDTSSLGPSTIRDATGSFANVMGGDPWYNASVHGNNEFLSQGVYITSKAITGIEFRANNIESLENLEKTLSIFMQQSEVYIYRIEKIKLKTIKISMHL